MRTFPKLSIEQSAQSTVCRPSNSKSKKLLLPLDFYEVDIRILLAPRRMTFYLNCVYRYSPRMYPYFDVVVGLVWSHDLKSYAGGSLCYW
jgi:hypothetical protein